MKAAFLITLGIALLLFYGLVARGKPPQPAYTPPPIVVNVPVPPPPPQQQQQQAKEKECPAPAPTKPALFVTSIDGARGASGKTECAARGATCISMKDSRLTCVDHVVNVRGRIFERRRTDKDGNVTARRIKLDTSPIIFEDNDEKKAYMIVVCERGDRGAVEW